MCWPAPSVIAPVAQMSDAHRLGDLLRLALAVAVSRQMKANQFAAGAFQQIAGQDRVDIDRLPVGIDVALPQIAVLVVQPS